MCTRYRKFRAVLRAGELLTEIKASKGGQPTHKRNSTQSLEGLSRKQAAANAGLTPKQAKTAIEWARLQIRKGCEFGDRRERALPAVRQIRQFAGFEHSRLRPLSPGRAVNGEPRCTAPEDSYGSVRGVVQHAGDRSVDLASIVRVARVEVVCSNEQVDKSPRVLESAYGLAGPRALPAAAGARRGRLAALRTIKHRSPS